MAEEQKILIGVDIDSSSLTDLANLKAQIDSLKKAQKELDTTTEEGAKEFQKMNIEIKSLTQTYNKQTKEIVNANNKVGGLKGKWQEFSKAATGALGNVSRGFSNFVKVVATNPIGLALTAIVAVFSKLVDKFKQSDSAMTALQRAFATFQPVIDIINKAFNSLVDILAKALDGFTNLALQISKGLGVEKAAQDAVQLADAIDYLEESQRKAGLQSAIYEQQLADLNTIMRDTSKTEEERLAAADSYIATFQKLTNLKADLQIRNLWIEWEKLANSTGKGSKEIKGAWEALNKQFSELTEGDFKEVSELIESIDWSDEQKKGLQDLVTQLYQLNTEYTTGIDRATRTRNKIITDGQEAEAKAIEEGTKKKIAEYDKERQEVQKLVESYYNLQGAINAAVLKGDVSDFDNLFNTLTKGYKEGLVSAEDYFSTISPLMELYAQQLDGLEEEADVMSISEVQEFFRLKAENAGATAEEIYNLTREQIEAQMALYDKDSLEYQRLLKKKQDLEKSYSDNQEKTQEEQLQNTLGMAAEIANAAGEAVQEIFSAVTDKQKEQIESQLQAQLDAYTVEEEALQEKLDKGLISEAAYNAQLEDIEKRRTEAQANADYQSDLLDWKNSMLQVAINTALGISNAVAQNPMMGGLPGSAIAAALGAVQLAIVAANKPQRPKFANGGIAGGGLLQGPSHKQGGIQIEAEGGEAIINKRSTAKYRGLLSAINEAGGGVSFANVGGHYFAQGGITADGGYSTRSISRQVRNNLPPIYVSVEEINRGQSNYAKVVNNRTL